MSVLAVNSSLQGIYKGFQGLRNNAHTIANTGLEKSPLEKDTTEAIVGLTTNSQQVEVNAKALKIQDEVLGTLLDELA